MKGERQVTPTKRRREQSDECALCLEIRVLHESHIVSRWAHKRLLHGLPPGEPASPVRIEGGRATRNPKQEKEYLLCTDCEANFKKSEDYVFGIAAKADGTFPGLKLIKDTGQSNGGEWRHCVSDGLEIEQVAKFGLSVIWRASVTSLPLYTGVVLGDADREAIRLHLHSGAPLRNGGVLFLELVDDSRAKMINKMIMPPHLLTNGGANLYEFFCWGFRYRYFLGPSVPAAWSALDLCRTGTVALSDGRDLREELTEVVAALRKLPSRKS